MTKTRVKPAFAWPGGKSWALKYILPNIPEHICYCEPFAGGLAVLLAKERSKIEVVNDISRDIINFYRCVRFHSRELLRELQYCLNSRLEFYDFSAQRGLTDIQRAARWFWVQRLSFGGCHDHGYATGKKSGGGSNKSIENMLRAIEALRVRLDRVNIENLDYERCLKLYDGSGTFFFLDPPYTQCSRTAFGAWSQENMFSLKDILTAAKGQWLLTVNDNPDNQELFSNFGFISLSRQRRINIRATKQFSELLISSPGINLAIGG